MRCQRFPSLTVSLMALGLPFLGAPAARADDLFSRVPTVHVPIPGLASQAQLAEQLHALGYSDVILSSTYPSPANPHPELNPTLTSHPEQTPVHAGWNGIAVKDGQLVQVYAGP
jgi:hypothetical protein